MRGGYRYKILRTDISSSRTKTKGLYLWMDVYDIIKDEKYLISIKISDSGPIVEKVNATL